MPRYAARGNQGRGRYRPGAATGSSRSVMSIDTSVSNASLTAAGVAVARACRYSVPCGSRWMRSRWASRSTIHSSGMPCQQVIKTADDSPVPRSRACLDDDLPIEQLDTRFRRDHAELAQPLIVVRREAVPRQRGRKSFDHVHQDGSTAIATWRRPESLDLQAVDRANHLTFCRATAPKVPCLPLPRAVPARQAAWQSRHTAP
jgi:hypothetical protein